MLRRNHGGVLFFDVRDASGLVQATVVPEQQPEAATVGSRLRQEYVVAVTGAVRRRQVPNPNLPTGDGALCLRLTHLQVRLLLDDLSCSGLPPGMWVAVTWSHVIGRAASLAQQGPAGAV